MKALVLTAAEGVASAALRDVDAPSPKAGEVCIALKAAALNHRELWIARGQYPGMQLPCILGCDGAGVVESVGDGVDAGMIGREVMIYPGLGWGADPRFPAPGFGLLGMPGPGTVAERICVPAASAVDKPGFLTFAQAAAIPLAALTAWRALTTKAGLSSRDRVLITGIGGGVATFALKFAVASGAVCFVTSGLPETLALAQGLGAAGGFDYKDPELRKNIARTTGGIDVIIDGAPASSFASYVRALNMGARVVIYGSTGGMQFQVTATDLFLRNVSVVGTNVGNLQEFRDMLAFIERRQIEPAIDRTFSMDAAAEALGYFESSRRFGKIVITI
jgi:NADPH:quinone reductase-like Zn-dependent oxidoreductase